MNKINLILILLFFSNQLFSQDSLLTEKGFVIEETITIIDKAELFVDWKKMAKDTLNPTSIKIDLNGDEKLDMVGFFTGIENGLFIFGNIEEKGGNIEQLYKLDFDNTWFKENKFQAVIAPIMAEEKIISIETGLSQALSQNSALIKKSDGSKIVLTFMDNTWHMIKIK